jgi:hypothetical protein
MRTETLREAYIFRFAEAYGGSIFIDVTELTRKAKRQGSEDVLLSRFEKGIKVPRVEAPDKGPLEGMRYYRVFGPTIIATNEPFAGALGSRTIEIAMPPSSKNFPTDITEELGLPRRARLVAFRARHLGKELPDANKEAKGRLGDITLPLIQIVRLVAPDQDGHLLNIIEQAKVDRLEGRTDSIEGEIIQALVSARSLVEDGTVSVSQITNIVNGEIRKSRFETTTKKVGMRLRSLGLKRGARRGNQRTVIWDEPCIKRQAEDFGIEWPPEEEVGEDGGDGEPPKKQKGTRVIPPWRRKGQDGG